MYGGHTRGDFEHAEVAMFIGKNPWQSQSFPRARVVLRDIARDPERCLIVIDPVRSDTAELADIHLRVVPGGRLVPDGAAGRARAGGAVRPRLPAATHHRYEEVLSALAGVPVADYAARAGVDVGLIRNTARRIARADSVATFEDLGIQQGPNSVLCSYLNKLTWVLSGSFGKPGAMHLHSWLASLFRVDRGEPRTPVTGARILGGLVPCNVIAEEILTEHPDRLRAMLIESANPAHSLADSRRFREALAALELVVVIDVALTETARLADYVLPAASQFEKWEATFFNLEFPRNHFHLRAPLMEPLPGTLPEPEIYARLMRSLGVIDEETLLPLREAAASGRGEFALAFLNAVAARPELGGIAAHVLYETLGPTLTAPAGPGAAERVPAQAAAALWGLAHRCAMRYPDAVRRAGHANGEELFDAILAGRSGITLTVDDYEHAWDYVAHADHRIMVAIPELLAELDALSVAAKSTYTTPELPLVLSAGERRAHTANTIIRDPRWRKHDGAGALRISPADAAAIGLSDGGAARITTATGSAEVIVEISDAMQPGHISLPNGHGVRLTRRRAAVRPF